MQTPSNHYEHLLYFKTSQQLNYPTLIQHMNYSQQSHLSIKQYLQQLAYQFQKDIRLQQHIARSILNTTKRVPIYIHPSIVLSPLQSQRAPIQYYVNMVEVIAASSQVNATRIHFKNNTSLIAPIPLSQFVNQWKDAQLLSSLLQR